MVVIVCVLRAESSGLLMPLTVHIATRPPWLARFPQKQWNHWVLAVKLHRFGIVHGFSRRAQRGRSVDAIAPGLTLYLHLGRESARYVREAYFLQ
jgi:hypothetical protein